MVKNGTFSLPEGVNLSTICSNMISGLIRLDKTKRMSFLEFSKHPLTQQDSISYQKYLENYQRKLESNKLNELRLPINNDSV